MYPHRINHDGTIDSICTRYYASVGTSTTENDLKRMEAAHARRLGAAFNLNFSADHMAQASTDRSDDLLLPYQGQIRTSP